MKSKAVKIVLEEIDVIEYIGKIKSMKQLTAIKHALYDESQTQMLSNKTIHRALELINEQIKTIKPEDAIQELFEILF